MADADSQDPRKITERLQEQAADDAIRLTVHGHQEMVEEDISYRALREALLSCRVLENYPDHQRGPCCLVCGRAQDGRYLHVVCTTTLEVIVVITVYEPKAPKWRSAFQRGGGNEM